MTDTAHALPRAAVFSGSHLQEGSAAIRVSPSLHSSFHSSVPTICLGSVHVARNILETMHEALRMWRGRDRALFEDSSAVGAEQRGQMWWGMYQGRPLFFTTQETAERFRQCRSVSMFKDVAGGTSSVTELKDLGEKVRHELQQVKLPEDRPAPPPRYPFNWMDQLMASWQPCSERVAQIGGRLQHAVRWSDLSALPGLGVPMPGAGLGAEGWSQEELQQLSGLFKRFVSAACAQHAVPILRYQQGLQEVGPGVNLRVVPPKELPDLGPSFRTGMVPLKDILQLGLSRAPLLVCDEHDVAAATAPHRNSAQVEGTAAARPHVPALRVAGLQLAVRQPDGRMVAFLPAFLSGRQLQRAIQLGRSALQRNWQLQRHVQRKQQMAQGGVPSWLVQAWCEASWMADGLALKSPWSNQLLGLPENIVVLPSTLDTLASRIAAANAATKGSSHHHHAESANTADSNSQAMNVDADVSCLSPDGGVVSVLNAVWQILAQDAWLLAQQPRHEPQLPNSLLQVLATHTEGDGTITWEARALPLANCDCGKQTAQQQTAQQQTAQQKHLQTSSEFGTEDFSTEDFGNARTSLSKQQTSSGKGFGTVQTQESNSLPDSLHTASAAVDAVSAAVPTQLGGALHKASGSSQLDDVEEGIVAMFISEGRRHDIDKHLCGVRTCTPADLVLSVNVDQLCGRARDTLLDAASRSASLKQNSVDENDDGVNDVGESVADKRDAQFSGKYDGYGMLLVGDMHLGQVPSFAWPPSDLQFSMPFNLEAWKTPINVGE